MSSTASTHPTPDQLAAFASRQPPGETAAALGPHLADCEACRKLVERLREDVRPAPPQGPADSPTSSLPGAGRGPHEEATRAEASAAAPAGGEIPPELAGHPRYHVLGLVGAGGMGAVYKAEHRLMERCVALKVISPGLVNNPAMVERFRREVKAAARLAHPNIVTAYDADQAGDAHFLVMEYVEGQSLDQWVRQNGRLPVAEACEYIRQAALGLQHAFECGMVHRDVKPHNLMLTPAGQVKILDFGLARLVREAAAGPGADAASAEPGRAGAAAGGLTQAGSVMGTVDFIAPEQAADPRRADVRADVYSLGCTLYYLLAGRVPFPEGTTLDKLTAHCERAPTPLTRLRRDVPAALARVVDRMTAKDPARRYPTPAQAGEALAPFARGSRAPGRKRIRLLVAGAAVLLGVALLVGAAVYFRAGAAEPTDEQKIQGAWVAVRGERDGGTPLTDDELSEMRIVFAGEKVRVRMPGGRSEGMFALDPGKRPKRLTFLGNQADNFQGMQGIYILEGDTLQVCIGRPGEVPTEFRSEAGTGIWVVVFRRDAAAQTARRDEDELQGAWRVVGVEEGGRAFGEEDVAAWIQQTLTFEGDQVRAQTEYVNPRLKEVRPDLSIENEMEGIFHINATTNPKRISFFRPDSKTSLLGVYSLEGDALRICYYQDPRQVEYPAELRTKPGGREKVLVLKRQPAAPPP
jgi:uncharacterized protein (TIGR03067 family)